MPKMIPWLRPPSLKGEELEVLLKRIRKILKSGMLSPHGGPYVTELESRLKEMLGVDYVHTCGSCTVGLILALRAVKLRRRYGGNIVAIPAFSWISDLHAVTQNGYRPLFLDVDVETWNITDVPYVADAVIPVHWGGNVCEVKADVPVIYDMAHSLGASIRDFGTVSVFSLHATKNVPACEGGVIVTNDREVSRRIVELRDRISRLSEIHAAVALTYLEKLPETVRRKRMIFEYYRARLPYKFQRVDLSHSYSMCGILCEDREEVLKKIEGKVDTRGYSPLAKGFRNSDYLSDHIIILPSYPDVNEKAVVKWIKRKE